MNLKFRAVSDIPIVEMDEKGIPHEDAIVVGMLVGDRICGEIVTKDGKSSFEWTCSVFEGTLEPVFELDFKTKLRYVVSILVGKSWIK